MVGGVDYKTDHADATYYKVDDIVKYDSNIMGMYNDHLSTSAVLDTTKFSVFLQVLNLKILGLLVHNTNKVIL